MYPHGSSNSLSVVDTYAVENYLTFPLYQFTLPCEVQWRERVCSILYCVRMQLTFASLRREQIPTDLKFPLPRHFPVTHPITPPYQRLHSNYPLVYTCWSCTGFAL